MMRRLLVAGLVVASAVPLGASSLAGSVPAAAAASAAVSPAEACPAGAEWQLADLVNGFRASLGRPALGVSAELTRKAQAWADHLATIQTLVHSTLSDGVSAGWQELGENIAYSGSVPDAQTMLEHSPPHYRNLVGNFTELGVGVTTDSKGTVWVVEEFALRTTPTATYGGPASATAFQPMTPRLVLDTVLAPSTVRRVKVAGLPNIPSPLTAVSVTLEVTGAKGAGWFQMLGPSDHVGSTSTLFVSDGAALAPTITQVAADGTIGVVGTVDARVRVRVTGWFRPAMSRVAAGRFVATGRTRVLDRVLGRGATQLVQVLGVNGMPSVAKGVRAVAVDVTTFSPTALGGLQLGLPTMLAGAWDSAIADPKNPVRATMVVVPVDAAGRIAVRTTVGARVVLDVRGWFTGGHDTPSDRGLFVPAAAARLLDTRTGSGAATGEVGVAGADGMPSCPSGVAGTVSVFPTASGRATPVQVGPWQGFTRGLWGNAISSSNGRPEANEFLVATGAGHALGVERTVTSDAVVDVVGWFV